MDEIVEIECNIKELFDAISVLEKVQFEQDKEYLQKSKIKLQNENNEWCDVVGLITKSASTRNLMFNTGIKLGCADNHLIRTEGSDCVNDEIICIKNDTKLDDEIVYDLQIDTPSHLYRTANGIIHHNTLIAQSIAKLLDVPFIIADATSLTESGLTY